jgi:putative ATPase
VAAAQAVELVGLPEARLNLAEAAIYLARAPKSNAVLRALSAATEDAVRNDAVPAHLRDSHYPAAKRLGYGKGYVYPHADPEGAEGQQYRPERFKGRRYFAADD